MVIDPHGGFFTRIQPKRKACQTYGRLQIPFRFVVEWRLIFEMLQWDFLLGTQEIRRGRGILDLRLPILDWGSWRKSLFPLPSLRALRVSA